MEKHSQFFIDFQKRSINPTPGSVHLKKYLSSISAFGPKKIKLKVTITLFLNFIS